jgi:hypothetical protein
MAGKIYKVITIIVLFLFTVATAFAQDEVPCGGDPDDGDYDPNNCPLDTWVILLVALALILTVIHLHRRRKLGLRS